MSRGGVWRWNLHIHDNTLSIPKRNLSYFWGEILRTAIFLNTFQWSFLISYSNSKCNGRFTVRVFHLFRNSSKVPWRSHTFEFFCASLSWRSHWLCHYKIPGNTIWCLRINMSDLICANTSFSFLTVVYFKFS